MLRAVGCVFVSRVQLCVFKVCAQAALYTPRILCSTHHPKWAGNAGIYFFRRLMEFTIDLPDRESVLLGQKKENSELFAVFKWLQWKVSSPE